MTGSDKNSVFAISSNWIEFAHGPAAESGNDAAKRLSVYPVKRGSVQVPVADREAFEEIKNVAELYTRDRSTPFGDTTPMQAARVIKRVTAVLNGEIQGKRKESGESMDIPEWLAGLETRIAKVLLWQRIESREELIQMLERGDDIPRIREYSRGRIQAWLNSDGAASTQQTNQTAICTRRRAGAPRRMPPTLLEQARALQASALFELVKSHMNCKNDAALSRAIGVSTPTISKTRNGRLPIGAGMLIRLHEETGIPIRKLKAYLTPLG